MRLVTIEGRKNQSSQYWHRFVAAVAIGLSVGIAFSLFATLLLLFGGTDGFSELGVSAGAALMLYMVGGLAGGVVAGLLNPLARSLCGFVVIGIAATIPMSIGTGVLLSGAFWERTESLFAFGFTTVVFGGGMGWIIHNGFHSQTR